MKQILDILWKSKSVQMNFQKNNPSTQFFSESLFDPRIWSEKPIQTGPTNIQASLYTVQTLNQMHIWFSPYFMIPNNEKSILIRNINWSNFEWTKNKVLHILSHKLKHIVLVILTFSSKFLKDQQKCLIPNYVGLAIHKSVYAIQLDLW